MYGVAEDTHQEPKALDRTIPWQEPMQYRSAFSKGKMRKKMQESHKGDIH